MYHCVPTYDVERQEPAGSAFDLVHLVWNAIMNVTTQAEEVAVFEVSVARIPASRWTYQITPDGDATIVTETWTDRRPRWFAVLAGATMGIDDIRAHNQRTIEATLANLATVAERSS